MNYDSSQLACFPIPLVNAASRDAEHRADLAAAAVTELIARLRERGVTAGPTSFPAAFLLELGAIEQIREWETRGMKDLLPKDLPDWWDARRSLFERLRDNPHSLFDMENAPLFSRVTQVVLSNTMWLDSEVAQLNVCVAEVDEDEFLDAVAQLLWSQRNSSSQN